MNHDDIVLVARAKANGANFKAPADAWLAGYRQALDDVQAQAETAGPWTLEEAKLDTTRPHVYRPSSQECAHSAFGYDMSGKRQCLNCKETLE